MRQVKIKMIGKILSLLFLALDSLQAMEPDHMEDESHQIQIFYNQLVALNPECQFNEQKILVDYINKHAIYLSSSNIQVIPTEIGACTALQALYLTNNPRLASLFGPKWSQIFIGESDISEFRQLCREKMMMIETYMLLMNLSVEDPQIDTPKVIIPKELITVIFSIFS